MRCTCWLFSPMGTVLRQTYPGFLWTQKWKSINNLNFFKENFSSLMNIQAWLQLNSKIEFSECFWMHYKHDKRKPQTACLTGRQCLKKIPTLPSQVHIKMRQLNCSRIYLDQSWDTAQGMPSHIMCAVFTWRFWKQICGHTKKSPIKWNKYFIS